MRSWASRHSSGGSHPTLGLLPPAAFLTATENTGLMMPLTLQALRQAMAQWREWHDNGLDLTMSVNISARNIQFDFRFTCGRFSSTSACRESRCCSK